MKMRTLIIIGLLLFVTTGAARSELLQGGIDKTEILPKMNFQLLKPKLDSSGLSFPEQCIGINPTNVTRVNIDGRWQITDGSHWLLDFGNKPDEAAKAVEAIKYYRFTDMCSCGDPHPSHGMQYFLVNGQAPSGIPLTGEDAIPFNLDRVKAEEINGSWKVTEGDHWMMDFAGDEESARHAAEVLHHYGFADECYIGRPGAPMMYFRK